MPVSALWALVGGFALLAFGLALRVAEISHGLKRSNDEALSLKSKIDSLKDTHNKEISGIKEFHSRKVEELTKEIERLTHENASKPNKEDSPDSLSDEAIDMLRVIAAEKNPLEKDSSVEHILNESFLSESFQFSPQKTKYHLDQLKNSGLISYDPYGDLRGITEKGRALLFQRGLLP